LNADNLKANLAGGNSLSGEQSVAGNVTVSGGHIVSIANSAGAGWMYSWPEYYTSGNITGLNAVTHLKDSSGTALSWMALRGADGSVWTSAGKLAFASQIPTAGTITNGTYTKVPLNDGSGQFVLTQVFSVASANNGDTIAFPMAYSSPPKATATMNTTYAYTYVDYSLDTPTVGGVIIHTNSSNTGYTIVAQGIV
jgi:hypothetical protein